MRKLANYVFFLFRAQWTAFFDRKIGSSNPEIFSLYRKTIISCRWNGDDCSRRYAQLWWCQFSITWVNLPGAIEYMPSFLYYFLSHSSTFGHSYIPWWWKNQPSLNLKTETTFHYFWRVKRSFNLVWMESTSPCNSLSGHLFKCMALLLVGLTISLLTKTCFDPLCRKWSIVF